MGAWISLVQSSLKCLQSVSVFMVPIRVLQVIAHMMPDLPNVGWERDMESFREFFENPAFRSDGLKVSELPSERPKLILWICSLVGATPIYCLNAYLLSECWPGSIF